MSEISKVNLYWYDSEDDSFKSINKESDNINFFVPKVELYWYDSVNDMYKPLITNGIMPVNDDVINAAKEGLQGDIDNLTHSKIETVNIKEQFGAVDDGITDNTQSFLDAVVYAKGTGDSLYLPKGDYYVGQNLLIDGIKDIKFEGTISIASDKTVEITYNSLYAPCDWKIRNVSGGKLRLSGLNSAKVEVSKASFLELYAHGDIAEKEFIAYNTFVLGKVDVFNFASEGTNIGWINENRFYGGRCQSITIDGNYPHDNNVFYGLMLESFTLNIVNGHCNYFYDVRFEGSNTITFGANATCNMMYQTYHDSVFEYLRDGGIEDFTENGFGNQIISNFDASYNRERLFNINSNTSNYSLQALTRNEHDVTIKSAGEVLYESDLIELKNPMSFILKSNKSLFSIMAYGYDANRNLLQVEYPEFIDIFGGGVFYSSTGAYTADANMGIAYTGITFVPHDTVKYFKYKLSTGSGSTVGQSFDYLKLEKKEQILNPTPMQTVNRIDRWVSDGVPTSGYWTIGDIVYNLTPTANTPTVYWVRVTDGSENVLGTDWIAK
jgi:hypothetical protein